MSLGLGHIIYSNHSKAQLYYEKGRYNTYAGTVSDIEHDWFWRYSGRSFETRLKLDGVMLAKGKIHSVSSSDYFRGGLEVTNMRIWFGGLKEGDPIRYLKHNRFGNHRHAFLIQKCD